MDDRLVEFIAALRAAGVRVSIAESADALRAMAAAGIRDRELFRLALRSTLVKEVRDHEQFDELFPSFFGAGAPPMPNQPGQGMGEDDQQKLEQALREMLEMTPEQLRQLFEAMMRGVQMEGQALRDMLQPTLDGMPNASRYAQQQAMRRAMRDLDFSKLEDMLQQLIEKMREAGISEEQLQQLARDARENREALAEQIQIELAQGLLRRELENRPPQRPVEDLLDKPLEHLAGQEIDDLRGVVTKLAARLRSRAALRHRRASKGTIDAKSTIRSNLRYGGVPLEIRHRRKHLKPKIVVIVDRSRSTETVVSFLLMLLYAMQDQISRTRTFAFIDTIHDISRYFDELRPEDAIPEVMRAIQPSRSYSTDLGNSLKEFMNSYGGVVDQRTTVILLGDARNNENDPNLAAFAQLKARAKRIIWFNPESRAMWGRYDPGSLSSDMLAYAPMCDAVHEVRNLRQLSSAVESLFG
ncbi:MAG: VWA domain-containing protein [Roseiflexaceae bacterium]|nr:VWA domain-containing protein [Roseiflexaceae bacterium]